MANARIRAVLPIATKRSQERTEGPSPLRLAWHLAPWLLPGVAVLLWVLGSEQGWISQQILPPPALVIATLHDMAYSGDLWTNVSASLTRIAIGFGLGVAGGLALGAILGLSRVAETYVLPTFNAIVQIPLLGWLPFLMLLVGIGEPLKYLLIAHAAFVPVTLSTLQGFREPPKGLMEVARTFRLSPWQTIISVILPAAAPVIGTGIRLAFTKAWLALVVVEMLAASSGLGYLVGYGRQLFQLDLVLASVLIIALIGYCADRLLTVLESKLHRG
ncbi:sulfonate transport system permease protein [Robbsia andropogonis]|uniref:ABC transporter permease n=1 Tax=Robbsia andropogonis TaxID=28092 RepID=UPI003D1F2C69